MPAYYNENDRTAAAWLRELIRRGLIALGEVDERSIAEVSSSDLRGFEQCHFFAGIGVWSHALRQSGWPDDAPVWTGSCPCQPFSTSGKGEGFSDQRHLWPTWFRLIRECQPDLLVGEQVANDAGLAWFDIVSADLEGAGYAVGACDTCAAGVGAPHIRQRLYWVADTSEGRRRSTERIRIARRIQPHVARSCTPGSMANADSDGARQHARELPGHEGEHEVRSAGGDYASRDRRPAGELADTDAGGLGEPGSAAAVGGGSTGESHAEQRGPANGFWRNAVWIPCRDGKARPVEPGTFPLVTGTPHRVGRLRGYGNSLVAPQAVAFIEAYLEILSDVETPSK